jgi:hypothetical protein
MSDNENRDLFEQERSAKSELLDELDSLKELLDEDIENVSVPATVNEIRTVQEYMQFKQEADAAGMTLDAYLAKRSSEQQEEEEIPTLDEVVPFDDIGEIDDGLEIPTLEEAVEIPTLEEEVVAAPAPAATSSVGTGFSLEEIERIVEHIVQLKLQEIKPQLEKQVFDQIRNMLPVDRFK